MMKNTKFALSFFAVFAFALLSTVTLASAATLVLTPTNVPATVSHNQGNIQIQFNLTHTGESQINQTGLVWVGGTNIGTWTNLPVLDKINVNQVIPLSAVLTIPRHSSGTITANINVTSDTSSFANLPITIQIQSSPELDIEQVQAITETQDGIIKVTNTGNVDFSQVTLSRLSGDFEVDFSQTVFALNAGNSIQITVSPRNLGQNIPFGGKSVTIKATANNQQQTSDTFTMTVRGAFCRFGEIGVSNMSVSIDSIDNRGDSEDSDDTVWVLGDTIEIEVDVENLMTDDDLKDITVEMGIFDSNGKNIADDMDFSTGDEKYDLGRIKDDDTETATFRFRVTPDIKTGDYTLVFKAYDDGDEDELCVEEQESESIDIRFESEEERFMIIDDITFDNSQLICGETLSGDFTVFNIGDETQERTKIVARNERLGINQIFEITKDMDEGDDETLSFSFQLPNNVEPGRYPLSFYTEYSYDNGFYDVRSDDTWEGMFEIISCSGFNPGSQAKALITPRTTSDPVAGQKLTIQTTITNIAGSENTYSLDVTGFESWASLDSISTRTFTLGSQESVDVTITLDVDEDASGTQSLTIQALSGSTIDTRRVEVNVQGNRSGITGFSLFGEGNGYVWLLVLVNVILIILIVVVAVRLSRR